MAGLQPDLLRAAIRTLLDSSGYDAVAVIVGSSGVAMPDLMANAIGACLAETDKPVVAYVSPHAPQALALVHVLNVSVSGQQDTAAAQATLAEPLMSLAAAIQQRMRSAQW